MNAPRPASPFASLRPALVLFLLLSVLTGFLYPLIVTGLAQLLFPVQAAGSLVAHNGQAVGSRLIGQSFSDPGHFWSRPSATTPQPYNGIASGGSNFGPLNPSLTAAIKARVEALHLADQVADIPGDFAGHLPVAAQELFALHEVAHDAAEDALRVRLIDSVSPHFAASGAEAAVGFGDTGQAASRPDIALSRVVWGR